MPTGYTADIAKGITFQQFALSCARAFGATVTMRDDPKDAEIPDEIKPCDYNAKRMAEANRKLAKLKRMTLEQAEKAAIAEAVCTIKRMTREIRGKLILREQYNAMLEKVKSWTPPTREHECMKAFMIQKITDSIPFDCDTTYYNQQLAKAKRKVSARKWLRCQIEAAEKDLAYHTEEHAKEVQRCSERSKWIQDLKASLK